MADNIGRLDAPVTIIYELTTPDGLGGLTRVWLTLAETWGEILTPRGRQYFLGDEAQEAGALSLRIRYRNNITVLHRVLLDGAVYHIRAVVPVKRRQWLVLDLEEVRGEAAS